MRCIKFMQCGKELSESRVCLGGCNHVRMKDEWVNSEEEYGRVNYRLTDCMRDCVGQREG